MIKEIVKAVIGGAAGIASEVVATTILALVMPVGLGKKMKILYYAGTVAIGTAIGLAVDDRFEKEIDSVYECVELISNLKGETEYDETVTEE